MKTISREKEVKRTFAKFTKMAKVTGIEEIIKTYNKYEMEINKIIGILNEEPKERILTSNNTNE